MCCCLEARGRCQVLDSSLVKQQHRKKTFSRQGDEDVGSAFQWKKAKQKVFQFKFFKVGPVLLINASACLSYRNPCGCYTISSNLF